MRVLRAMPSQPRLRTFLVVLLVALAVGTIAGCEAEAPPSDGPIDGHPGALAGTSWAVSAIGGVATARDAQPLIGFDATTAKGSGGCNSFGGRYDYDPATGELRFRDVGMTAMACVERGRNEVETAFIQALGQPVLVATFDPDGHLVLASPTGGRLDLVAVGPTVTD